MSLNISKLVKASVLGSAIGFGSMAIPNQVQAQETPQTKVVNVKPAQVPILALATDDIILGSAGVVLLLGILIGVWTSISDSGYEKKVRKMNDFMIDELLNNLEDIKINLEKDLKNFKFSKPVNLSEVFVSLKEFLHKEQLNINDKQLKLLQALTNTGNLLETLNDKEVVSTPEWQEWARELTSKTEVFKAYLVHQLSTEKEVRETQTQDTKPNYHIQELGR